MKWFSHRRHKERLGFLRHFAWTYRSHSTTRVERNSLLLFLFPFHPNLALYKFRSIPHHVRTEGTQNQGPHGREQISDGGDRQWNQQIPGQPEWRPSGREEADRCHWRGPSAFQGEQRATQRPHGGAGGAEAPAVSPGVSVYCSPRVWFLTLWTLRSEKLSSTSLVIHMPALSPA